MRVNDTFRPDAISCSHCGEPKSLDHFWISKAGYVDQRCRSCRAAKDARYRANQPDAVKEKFARWRAKQDPKIHADYNRLWYVSHREQSIKAVRRWQQANPERAKASHRASQIICQAVKDGTLTRPDTCEECGRGHTVIEGAHADYNYPFEVRWLCVPCHRRWDAQDPKTLH